MSRIPISLTDLSANPELRRLNPHLFAKTGGEVKPERKGQKKAKYGNQKVEVEGIDFDSKKEAKRFTQLRLLLKAGKIKQLARQVEYELNVGGTHSLIYRADFVYIDCSTGETVVEDVKGMRTREYLKKRRLMKQVYNIHIIEL